jgi:endonuclease G
MKKFTFTASFLALILILKTGCATQQEVARPAYFSVARTNLQAGFSPETQARIDKHCPFGLPRLDSNWNFGPTDIVARDGYVLQHSAVDKIPFWVCEHVTVDQLTGKAPRGNPFKADPLLASGRRAELSDYASASSVYDRGHQAPAGDQTRNQQLKDDTFYLSNMAPQVGQFNRQIWKQLEERVRKWMIASNGGFIITGGFFYNESEETVEHASGVIRHKVIGRNAVAVPTHFYKIALIKGPDNHWKSIAFVLKNQKYSSPYHFEQYIHSIKWIEDRTGINFLGDLGEPDRSRLENQSSPLWN